MEFLTDRDIAITIEEDNLLEIINDKTFLKDEAEKRATTTIKEYLSQRYDMEWELRPYVDNGTNGTNGLEPDERFIEDEHIFVNGTNGLEVDDRNYSLITIGLDIFKYELFQRIAPRAFNQIVMDRFDLSMQKLKDANRGNLQMDLRERYEPDNQDYRPFRYGQSSENLRNKY
jgi:hypothetical protein